MNISEIFLLAKEKGVKISFLNELIGGYRGKLTECKNGKSKLSENEIKIITDYLLGNEKKSLSEKDKLIAEVVSMLNAKSDDEIIAVKDMLIAFAKSKGK